VTTESTQQGKWIVTDSPISSGRSDGETPPLPHDGVAPTPNGPISTGLIGVLNALVPGARVVSAEDFPAVSAGAVEAVLGTLHYSLSVQKLQTPINFQDISLGHSKKDVLKTLPSGSQTVSVYHALPHTSQSILVTAPGTMLTFSVSEVPAPSSKVTSSARTADLPDPLTLTTQISSSVDDAQIDPLIQ